MKSELLLIRWLSFIHHKLDGIPLDSHADKSQKTQLEDRFDEFSRLELALKELFMIIQIREQEVSENSRRLVKSLSLAKKSSIFKKIVGHGNDRLSISL